MTNENPEKGLDQKSNDDKLTDDKPEMGYQYLDTTFTGKRAPELSGAAAFFIPKSDQGTAKRVEE